MQKQTAYVLIVLDSIAAVSFGYLVYVEWVKYTIKTRIAEIFVDPTVTEDREIPRLKEMLIEEGVSEKEASLTVDILSFNNFMYTMLTAETAAERAEIRPSLDKVASEVLNGCLTDVFPQDDKYDQWLCYQSVRNIDNLCETPEYYIQTCDNPQLEKYLEEHNFEGQDISQSTPALLVQYVHHSGAF